MPVIWVDAQLSPTIAVWIPAELGVQARALRDLGLRDADDTTIFAQARQHDAIILTKDADFPLLLNRLGQPPRVIWLTCGNTTNEFSMASSSTTRWKCAPGSPGRNHSSRYVDVHKPLRTDTVR